MSVYVDDVFIPYRNMRMCHMWADTLSELLKMADAIGVSRRWLQEPPKASWVHFDVCRSMRSKAVCLGAIQTDRFGPLEFLARQRGDNAAVERIRQRRDRANRMKEIGLW